MHWLVVGLGNPGDRYSRTRHNLGFMVIDLLAERMNVPVKRSECRSLSGRGRIGETVVELAKPQTFMNLSGEAVKCLAAGENRSVDNLIVISDDLAIPYGTLRLRGKGSHGGQNGLRSIIDNLRTQEFKRLRIGIGPEHPVADASRFVLERFSSSEEMLLGKMLASAADAVEDVILKGLDAAMAKWNTSPASTENE
ncbi:MAG: aminoacyl-tRNA hydrolase [Acidobacteria bacterium]|nr:aminoacyl-tRNA hydrolase [Acidobacteriota bacterium]